MSRGLLWLTWRQHRWAIVGASLVAAVLVGWMLYLAGEMTTLYHECHDALCPSDSTQYAELSAPWGPVAVSNNLLLAVQYLPLLIGVFLGVPILAREHEHRTLVLAWSQDVSPARWFWTKAALLGVFVAATTAATSAASGHLARVLSDVTVGSLFNYRSFMVTGMLPLVTGVSWFAVGVALGAAVRRTLPAAFAAIAGFVGVQLGVQWRYPTLLTPISVFRHFDQPNAAGPDPDALRVDQGVTAGLDAGSNLFDASGRTRRRGTTQHLPGS